MTKHSDRDNRRFDEEGNTRPAGSNYISVDHGDDGLDRRGFLRCMAWAGTATVWALSGGVPKSFAIARAALLSESEKTSMTLPPTTASPTCNGMEGVRKATAGTASTIPASTSQDAGQGRGDGIVAGD